ncbi:MAG: flagellar export protein FliJ [Spirochaetes bacterium RBG_16_49_21]|nr:MAG: flagellar export protein FliJ [Spirochaetes bacterium RBG_16_49_21]
MTRIVIMKKFKFKLQTLLNIREAREREIQHELAQIVFLQNLERARQDELRRRIEEQQSLFSGRLRKGAYSANEAVLFERFVDVSLRAINTAEGKIRILEPQVREVRGRLVEASRARKVVEKLKERKKVQYDYELNRELSKENDEMNLKIYATRKKEMA